MYDIIIIGAGPAGMTAALYALRAKMNVLLLESELVGGQMTTAANIENYPAFKSIAGYELAQNMYEQLKSLDVTLKYEKVIKISTKTDKKTVTTIMNTYQTKTIIIANGVTHRKLNCKNEETFIGKGVSYCATCDGGFFKNKITAVVGGGNSALNSALYLSNIADAVHLIHRRDTFRGEPNLIEKVTQNNKIILHYQSEVTQINGSSKIDSITIRNILTKTSKDILINGLFVTIGLQPDNNIFSDIILLDDNGYIETDNNCQTNIKGIYAIGDTRVKNLRQIITASSDGAQAASQASAYVTLSQNKSV